jgi:hypothetical protein
MENLRGYLSILHYRFGLKLSLFDRNFKKFEAVSKFREEKIHRKVEEGKKRRKEWGNFLSFPFFLIRLFRLCGKFSFMAGPDLPALFHQLNFNAVRIVEKRKAHRGAGGDRSPNQGVTGLFQLCRSLLEGFYPEPQGKSAIHGLRFPRMAYQLDIRLPGFAQKGKLPVAGGTAPNQAKPQQALVKGKGFFHIAYMDGGMYIGHRMLLYG